MPTALDLLFWLGWFFPAISLLTLMASAHAARSGRNVSAVLIPFFGPLLLTLWIISTATSHFWIPVVWISDPGTMLFLYEIPQFVREAWHNSSWTRVLHLAGTQESGGRRGTLFLQADGRYVLQVTEPRGENEVRPGICAMSEPGTYQLQEGGTRYHLVSHTGQFRAISREPDGSYSSTELDSPDPEDFLFLGGWRWWSVH